MQPTGDQFAPPTPTPGVGGAPPTPPKKTSRAVSITVFAVMSVVIIGLVVALVVRSSDSPSAVAPAPTVADTPEPVSTTEMDTAESPVATPVNVTLAPPGSLDFQALSDHPQDYLTFWLDMYRTALLTQDTAELESMFGTPELQQAWMPTDVIELRISELNVTKINEWADSLELYVTYNYQTTKSDGVSSDGFVELYWVFQDIDGRVVLTDSTHDA